MKILDNAINTDIAAGNPIRLNLGSGPVKRDGFYSVDHLPLDGVAIVADLDEPLDLLPDNCVASIYSRHAFEHVDNFLPLMRELHRLVRPGGDIEIIVPHFSNVYGYSDPTHVRLFGLYSMYYFVASENQPKIRKVPPFYTDARFTIQSIKIDFYHSGWIDRVFSSLLKRIVNRTIVLQDFYERRLAAFFHAWQIRYCMRPEK
jgi:SAM-dependent methyltransferase